jgi:hypothetical protein
MIEAWVMVGAMGAAAASLSGEIRMALRKSQKVELYELAVKLGLHTHEKFII